VLLAPVPITPTKALTPSHLKGLLWLDVMYKATSRLYPTVYRPNRRTYDITLQTVGFWAYLDIQYPGESYADKSERWIGERYVELHGSGLELPPAMLAGYRERVQRDGWIHPASERILALWQGHYRALGLHEPGLKRSVPLDLDGDEAIAALAALDSCLDLRALGGPVFLDLTAQGIPLRQIVDARGVDNYLLCALRELLPLARQFDHLLLLCDEELAPDYLILERVLARAGASVSRLSLGRVPLEGTVRSSRAGGWQELTFDRFAERYLPRHGAETFRLGMRLYFIGLLGRTASRSFDFGDVDFCMERAENVLAAVAPLHAPEELIAVLRRCLNRRGYVDAYRLTSLFMAKRVDRAAAALLPLFV
jgi:hypothetical protein